MWRRARKGSFWCAARNVFSGYWRAPEKTAESFVHDDLGRRWFRTGDLARAGPGDRLRHPSRQAAAS